MAEAEETSEDTQECPKCEGKGKYFDPGRNLVAVRCEDCGGSGKVPK